MPSDARRFELPGIEELTKEQEAVLALPHKGRQLVVGGPGTGKTVVCLLRTRRHARKGDGYAFLVWNHLLLRASGALFGGGLEATTWNSWFWRQFPGFTGTGVPTLPADRRWKPTDWKTVGRIIEEAPEPQGEPPEPVPLVIDEGQDMPPGFYDALNQFGFEDIFVAADQNQQITEEHSSIRELRDALLADPGDFLKLTYNHRNPYPVALLAREFHTGDPASPPPELPRRRRGSAATPRLYYVNDALLPRIGRSVLRHWDQDPRRLIGVVAPDNRVRERYLEAVKKALDSVALDNGRPPIQTFHHGRHTDVRFDRGGILVINAQACKGLEFDTVVLADVDRHPVDAADPDRTRKLFYVMTSRARQRVVLFMNKGGVGADAVEELLPRDESVLRREDLTVERSKAEAKREPDEGTMP